MKALQGFPLAGNPLKIEFAKAVSANYYYYYLVYAFDFDFDYVVFKEYFVFCWYLLIQNIKTYYCNAILVTY